MRRSAFPPARTAARACSDNGIGFPLTSARDPDCQGAVPSRSIAHSKVLGIMQARVFLAISQREWARAFGIISSRKTDSRPSRPMPLFWILATVMTGLGLAFVVVPLL